MSVYKEIVAEAWSTWDKDSGMSFPTFIRRLSWQPRAAIMLYVLQSEVFNGGFDQWIRNGYLKDGVDTLYAGLFEDMLRKLPGNAIVIVTIQLVESSIECYERGDTMQLDENDRRFYKVVGDDAVYYNDLVEQYLYLIDPTS